MPDALALRIGVAPGDDHADGGDKIGDGGEKADGEIGEAEGLEHLRHPEPDAIEPDHEAEIDEAEVGSRRIERLADPRWLMGGGLFRLGGKMLVECIPLLRREPLASFGTVSEEAR